MFKTHSFPKLKVVCVGNLSVGGTGKTPMVEYLIRWALGRGIPTAVLSRGYGRKSRGVKVADERCTPDVIGDEPLEYFRLFGDRIKVVVAEKRVEGLQLIQEEFPPVRLVILDDAFQHRSVKADFSILLTTWKRPFWRDHVLPSGLLRESRRGLKRADFLIQTKTPVKMGQAQTPLLKIPFGMTTVTYGTPVMINGDQKDRIVSVAGLADNEPFFSYVDRTFGLKQSFDFPDHHAYTASDVDEISKAASDCTMLCTSKDAVKLSNFEQLSNLSWGYVPIKVEFLVGEELLLQKLEEIIDE